MHLASPRPLVGIAACALFTLSAIAAHSTAAAAPSTLTLDPTYLAPEGKGQVKLGYFPVPLPLTTNKPAQVKKEPAYRGTPKYTTLKAGNGPNSTYVIAVDEPADGDYRVYVDKNRNGDLTDDGDGKWSTKRTQGTVTIYGLNTYVLRASWGTPAKETYSGDYGFALYTFSGRDMLFSFRTAARTGAITVAGKQHKAILVENDANALFDKPVATDKDGMPTAKIETRPVWLLIDMNDDGKYTTTPDRQFVDIRAPFELAGKVYEATVTPDGSRLTLKPTTRVAAQLEPKQPKLLTAGTMAPNFTADALTGGKLSLADYKGKVVVLDFWATWCGPCQRSMPHIQKVYEAIKDKDVVVLGVCVWDERAKYDKWMETNRSKYGFTFAFDPTGNADNNMPLKLFGVSGIPTTYVIGKDGKVIDAIVGYDNGDHRVEDALGKAGITVPAESPAK